MMMNDVMSDAVFIAPSVEAVERYALENEMSAERACGLLLEQREGLIERAKDDPYRFGFEPDIFLVARAMLGIDVIGAKEEADIAFRMGWEESEGAWLRWAEMLRTSFGMPKPVDDLLISGANRSAKSEFAAKLCQQVMEMTKKRKRIVVGSQQWKVSLKVQQERLWKFFRPEERRNLRSTIEYIYYKVKTGFSGNSFIKKNASELELKFYSQDLEDAMEGLEKDLAWMDEEVPSEWLDSLRMRLASVRGKLLVTFTPVSGWTPAVAQYCEPENMRVVRYSQGYMLPRDGGKPAPWEALGLTKDELDLFEYQQLHKIPTTVPWSRPEDCLSWVNQEDLSIEPNMVEGRVWELVPRIGLCKGSDRAVIWFHGRDNPYGDPANVITKAMSNSNARDECRKRVYGIATHAMGKCIKAFNKEVHVMKAADMPSEGGEVVCVLDPCPTRNWAIAWYRVIGNIAYQYREWPSSYDIPGEGFPGPWAKDSAKKKGVNDGAKGEGQDSFGWGIERYKFEFARLEGWPEWKQWLEAGDGILRDGDFLFPSEDDLEEWDDEKNAEGVKHRIIDPRGGMAPGNTAKVCEETVIDMLNDAGMEWDPAYSGDRIKTGITHINRMLEYVRNFEGEIVEPPHFFVSDACTNTIDAFEKYRGCDGQKGARKDFIDLPRYFALGGFLEYGKGDEDDDEREVMKGGMR